MQRHSNPFGWENGMASETASPSQTARPKVDAGARPIHALHVEAPAAFSLRQSMSSGDLRHRPQVVQLLQASCGNAFACRYVARQPVIQRAINLGTLASKVNQARPLSGMTVLAFRQSMNYLNLVQAIMLYNVNPTDDALINVADAIDAFGDMEIADFDGFFAWLFMEVQREAGDLYLKMVRERLPKGVNDADTYKDAVTNCAATSVGALIGKRATAIKGKGADFGLGRDFFSEQAREKKGMNEMEAAMSGFENKGNGMHALQIEGIHHYVLSVFDAEGIKVKSRMVPGQKEPMLPVDKGVEMMSAYPPGTQFIVSVKGTGRRSRELGHVLYADNYQGKLKFYDFQRDTFHRLVKERELMSPEMKKQMKLLKVENPQLYKTITAAGRNVTVDFKTAHQPAGPDISDTPLVVDYQPTEVNPPSFEANLMGFLSFEPLLTVVERVKQRVQMPV